MSNSGIQMGGGTINAKQIVAGTGAKAILREGVSQGAMNEAFGRLATSISESSLPPEKIRELIDTMVSVKNETSKVQPEKSIIDRGLQLIEKSAGSVSAVGAAVKVVLSLLA